MAIGITSKFWVDPMTDKEAPAVYLPQGRFAGYIAITRTDSDAEVVKDALNLALQIIDYHGKPYHEYTKIWGVDSFLEKAQSISDRCWIKATEKARC